MTQPASAPPRGVIHDLGYRRFTGRRRSTSAVAGTLYATALGHCFGIRRTGKAKILPWLIAVVMLVPALVIAGIIIQLNRMSISSQQELFKPLETYFGYPYWTQLLLTIFVAAQAPVLFARDLRYRTIVLYFARPLSRTTMILTRLAALTTAVFAIVVVPLTIWFGVALSSDMPSGRHTRNYLAAVAGVAILSLMLAAVSAMVSALTTRTGLSVTGVVVVLMISSGLVTSVLGVASDQGQSTIAHLASAASPFTAVASLISGVFDQPPPVEFVPAAEGGWTLYLAGACLAWIVLPTLVLLVRTRRKASL